MCEYYGEKLHFHYSLDLRKVRTKKMFRGIFDEYEVSKRLSYISSYQKVVCCNQFKMVTVKVSSETDLI